MPVILSKNGKEAITVSRSNFESEGYLQKYIRNNPNTLPIREIKGASKFLPLSREFSTRSGPIDVLGVDEKGEIYIIEVKLEKNADKRKVVSQALDYGAAIWNSYENYDDLISDIERAIGKPLRDTLQEGFGAIDEELDQIISTIKENVRTGSFNFVVVMDGIEDRLKQLISFINENSNFSLFAVEFEYFRHEDLEIIYPRTYGTEIKKDRTTRGARNWDETTFFEDAQSKLDPVMLDLLRRFHDLCANLVRIEWGRGATYGTFQLRIDVNSRPMTLATVRSNATGWLGLGKLLELGVSPFTVKEFIMDLKSLGFPLDEERDAQIGKSPEFRIDVLREESNLAKFKDAVTKLLKTFGGLTV